MPRETIRDNLSEPGLAQKSTHPSWMSSNVARGEKIDLDITQLTRADLGLCRICATACDRLEDRRGADFGAMASSAGMPFLPC